MYDTVDFYLPMEAIKDFSIDDFLLNLSGITEHSKLDDGYTSFSGNLKNLRVFKSEKGIKVTGSLAKFYLGDNCQTLTRSDTKRAINLLSQLLSIPIEKAFVRRLDFGTNIIVNHKPKLYFKYLGELNKYLRQPQGSTLYYSNSLRRLVFYDKISEIKKERIPIPKIWENRNVIRYEIRFLSRLSKQFNLSELKASTLYDEKFYISLVNRWVSEYLSIQKIQLLSIKSSNMNSPKDFIKLLAIMGIQAIGHDKIMMEVEALREKKVFQKPEYYSRLKKEIKYLYNHPTLTEKSDLVDELDSKIKRVKME